MLPNFLKSTVATTIVLASTSSAFAAVDGQNVLNLLTSQLELQGLTLKSENVSVDNNDNVLLSNISLGFGEGEPLKFETFVLQNVSGDPDKGYVVERMALPPFSNKADDINFDFGGMAVDGYFIAGPAVTDPILKGNLYRKMTLGPITAGPDGKTAFSLSGGEINVSPYETGGTLEYDMSFNDMLIDFSIAPEPQVKETMKTLGYERVEGEITGKGKWDTTSGIMTLDPMTIAAKDAADLSISFTIGGYTPGLVQGLQEMQKTMPDNEQAMGMAMLGMLQQLDVRSIKIMLDDNSLTGRLLDFFGEQRGMDREGTVAFAKGMLPVGLSQLGNPEFTAKATASIGEYLEDPDTLVVEAAPENPVPVAAIMGAAAANPTSLINLLAIQVIANQ